jgi:hypothetical protein
LLLNALGEFSSFKKIVGDTDVRQLWKLAITASLVCFIAVVLQTANSDNQGGSK